MSYLTMIPLFAKDATPSSKEQAHYSSTMLVLHSSTFPDFSGPDKFLRPRTAIPQEGDESFIVGSTRTRSFRGTVKHVNAICTYPDVSRDYQYLYAKELKAMKFKKPNIFCKIPLAARILRGLGLVSIVCHESDMAVEALHALPDETPILVEMGH